MNPSLFENKDCLVDAAVRLNAIFFEEKACCWHMNLLEVRYKKSTTIRSSLDPVSDSESEDDESGKVKVCNENKSLAEILNSDEEEED